MSEIWPQVYEPVERVNPLTAAQLAIDALRNTVADLEVELASANIEIAALEAELDDSKNIAEILFDLLDQDEGGLK